MIKYKFFGKTENGNLQIYKRDEFRNHLLKLSGKEIEITVDKMTRKRTTGKYDQGEEGNQNGYYWTIIIPILGEYFGYLPDEIHEALKFKFLRKAGDDKLPTVKSSTKLNRIDWEDWMEKIRIWALADYNIKIPLPNEFLDDPIEIDDAVDN